MNPRFHAPGAQQDAVIALPDDEGRHLTRVLRLHAGDAIRVFDGRGSEFEGTVESIDGGVVHVRVGQPCAAAVEARVAVTLAQAVLKGDKMDDVVRDAVMMGVAAIQPIVTARTEVSRATLERAHKRERWERVAIASAKQSGRAVVPAILEPATFETLLESAAALRAPASAFMFVEPGAAPGSIAFGDLDPTAPREATIVIGPEGGWTLEELTAARGACRLVTIGGRTLRADAMATIAITAVFARWGEF